MSLHNVTPGPKAPDEFNVIIEIPMNADPIKYEVDHDTGAMFVDRFMARPCTTRATTATSRHFVRRRRSGGRAGDHPGAADPGCGGDLPAAGRAAMEDEAGGDNKLLAVPIDKILSLYSPGSKPEDLNPMRLKTIQHFFEHYKDLEPGKWVKVLGWEGPEAAQEEIRAWALPATARRHPA
jgi:inorganic pyrophosphatase